MLLTSMLTLQLEFLQTRIYSFALWHHFVYIAVTMALLGFSASGTALFLSTTLKRLSDEKFYKFALLGFSLSSFLALKYSLLPVNNTFALAPNLNIALSLILTYTLSMIPYFFAGLIIGGALYRNPQLTGKLYFLNLVGSGLGCVSFVYLISIFGAGRLLALTSLLVLIPLFSWLKHKITIKVVVLTWALFLGVCLFFGETLRILKITPEAHKQIRSIFKEHTKIEFTQWNPISRIDVISGPSNPLLKYVVMDGDAEAKLLPLTGIDQMLKTSFGGGGQADRNAAYLLLNRKPDRTLVIGAGGGFDVGTAILRGSLAVDAVEINPTTVWIATKLYAQHIDNIFSRDNVKLFNEDGRTFVRRSNKKYDIIMMFATDSLLALSTGSYVLLDNYLYTKEAFVDYFKHLSEPGFLQVGRWYAPNKPAETLRVFSTALEALKETGINDPVKNIAVINDVNWASVIIKKTPITPVELIRLRQFCDMCGFTMLFPETFSDPLGRLNNAPFVELAESISSGTQNKFYLNYPFNVNPVSDDSPFFYQFDKLTTVSSKQSNEANDCVRGVWYIFVLLSLLIQSIFFSSVFIFLPLLVSKKQYASGGQFSCLYFALLGTAFMFVEMSIVQKFVMFLGSPIYSMAVIIPVLLIFAGLGSLTSSGIRDRNLGFSIFVATITCGLTIILFQLLVPFISDIFLRQPIGIRIITVIISIAPFSFVMGFPFPLGLRLIGLHSKETVPWAWAINGAFSVISSILATILAMQFGFRMVLITSAALYFLAGLAGKNIITPNFGIKKIS